MVEGIRYNNSTLRIIYVIITLAPILASFCMVFLKVVNPLNYLICGLFVILNLILTKYIFGKRLIGITWCFGCGENGWISYDYPDDHSAVDPNDSMLFTWCLILHLPYWLVAAFFIFHFTNVFVFLSFLTIFFLQVSNTFIYFRGYNIASKKWEENAKIIILGNADGFKELPEQATIENSVDNN